MCILTDKMFRFNKTWNKLSLKQTLPISLRSGNIIDKTLKPLMSISTYCFTICAASSLNPTPPTRMWTHQVSGNYNTYKQIYILLTANNKAVAHYVFMFVVYLIIFTKHMTCMHVLTIYLWETGFIICPLCFFVVVKKLTLIIFTI